MTTPVIYGSYRHFEIFDTVLRQVRKEQPTPCARTCCLISAFSSPIPDLATPIDYFNYCQAPQSLATEYRVPSTEYRVPNSFPSQSQMVVPRLLESNWMVLSRLFEDFSPETFLVQVAEDDKDKEYL